MAMGSTVKYNAIQTGNNKSYIRSVLRAIGLKILILPEKLGGISFRNQLEQEQILIDISRKIVASRLAVHILPILITLSVFAMNWIEVLNGPQITAASTFFLQIAAKFHELTISGSLAAVVLDIIRHELLHEGLNLGLLVSRFSMTGLNFLWSTEFLSIFKTDYTKRKRLWLFVTIASCCILIGVVGPASALLFIPSQTWQPYGWTTFYLGATEQDLWPNQLAARHAGPTSCVAPEFMVTTICPAGEYRTVAARLQKRVQTSYMITLQDTPAPRIIRGWTPIVNCSWHQQKTHESWVQSSRGDVTFLLQDVLNVYRDAQKTATGRGRRLRDFVDGWYQINESRFPVGRTVCGPAQLVHNHTLTLPFPVLERNQKWRNISFGPGQTQGRLADRDISDTLQSFYRAQKAQVQAKWVALGSEHGAATAGLALLNRNATHTAGRGCTLDYRWALGQTYRKPGLPVEIYENHIGKMNTPSNAQNTYATPTYQDFLDPELTPFYGDVIKAGQDWLDLAFPNYTKASRFDSYNITTFESIIETTILRDIGMLMSDDFEKSFLSLSTLEYTAGVAFVDVLSRINWYKSLKYPDDSMMIDPVLQQKSDNWRQILNGATIYQRPENISTTTLKVHWYNYGTAWTLNESGQFFAVAILTIYLIIALVHSVVTLVRGTSMEAWDTITELVLLAWNSETTRRDIEFKNASVGVRTMKTMTHKVKVVAVDQEDCDSTGRVQLVVVNDYSKPVDGRATLDIVPGKTFR